MKWTHQRQVVTKSNLIAAFLKEGGIGIIPTDTMYGVVGSALDKKAVRRIYKVRKRTPSKPLIILIDSIDRLKDFSVSLLGDRLEMISNIWPDKITVILPCKVTRFKYLHRGTNKLAFRMPKGAKLLKLLRETGPLVAPSANPEGEKPARTLKEAQKYFGASVDFYIDGGKMKDVPSTIIEIDAKGAVTLVREGAVKASGKKLKSLLD